MYKKTIFGFSLFILLSFGIFSSFKLADDRKSHLIVGGFQVNDSVVCSISDDKNFSLEQLYFSSDEFTAELSGKTKDKETKSIKLSFKIYEEFEQETKPVLGFKSNCNEQIVMAFRIESLTKSELKLHFLEQYSSFYCVFPNEDVTFTRISGPEENME